MTDGSFEYTGADNLEVMADAVNYNRFLVNEVVAALPTGSAKILDYGAGAGTYAGMLVEEGLRPDCLEPDPSLRSLIAARGLDAVADVEEVKPESYDLVYSLNVFEHIEDDAQAARAILEKVRPGGRLLVYVPAFMALFSSMDTKVGHFRRYRKRPLVQLLQAAGFEVEHARYCDPLGFAAAFAFRFIGNRNGDINPLMIKVFDRLVFPLSRVLERLTGPFFGKNVLVTARRPD